MKRGIVSNRPYFMHDIFMHYINIVWPGRISDECMGMGVIPIATRIPWPGG